jgi:hypothetical protein
MKIPSSNTLLHSLTVTRASSGDIRHWQPGQQLQASVVSNVTNGLVNLRIGATILTAQLESSVKIGEKLLLEVISVGDKPVLQGLRNDSLQRLLESAIRQTLPKQQSHAQLLSDIKALLQQKQLPALPEKVQHALKQLYQSFADRNSASTTEGIKQAIRQSGLFMEAQLAGKSSTATISLEHDLKAGLLRLQKVIQQQLAATQSTAAQRPADMSGRSYSPSPALPVAGSPADTNPLRPVQLDASVGKPVLGTQSLQQNLTKPATGITAGTTGVVSSTNTPGNSANPLSTSSIPVATTNPGITGRQPVESTTGKTTPQTATPASTVTADNSIPAKQGVPGKTASIPATLTPGQGILSGLPAHLSTSQLAGSLNQAARLDLPFVYAGNLPFRINHDIENSRPSARFSRLDSLTKILGLFLKDADSSLARIQLNQLSQHGIEPEQKQAWLFEIPVKHKDSIDLFQFNIEKDSNKNQDDATDEKIGWTVHISFNIEQLGQVHSKVSIHQKQVSIIFWTEQQATTSAFLQHLQTLQQELEDSGLVVGHLNCIQGTPPESAGTHINKGVVDEQA